MKRWNFVNKHCRYCHKRSWFWQKLTVTGDHIPCLERDFWTRHSNDEDMKHRHFEYFGTRPWDNI